MRRLLALSFVLGSHPAWSQPVSQASPALSQIAPGSANRSALPLALRASAAIDVLRGKTSPEECFAPSFLSKVSPDQLLRIGRELAQQHGPILAIADVEQTGPGSARFQVRFQAGASIATITVEPAAPQLIAAFHISDFVPFDNSGESIVEAFRALPGAAGFTMSKLTAAGAQEMLGFQSDRQFAIGSTFKLWVLDALAEDIATGKRRWSDVVPLAAPSLPSGEMQHWPAGSPVTLATLATLMISISDNTATDTLMTVLGRDALAARVLATGHAMPARLLPMLTTLEAFWLKLSPEDQVMAYADADDAAQRALLDRLDPAFAADRIDPTAFGLTPRWIAQIEWFASPRDLVGVMQSLQRRSDPMVMQILAINSGTSAGMAGGFQRVAFKGGSEAGVINLTWLVQSRAGEWYVVSQSWNDVTPQSVDHIRFAALASRLLDRTK